MYFDNVIKEFLYTISFGYKKKLHSFEINFLTELNVTVNEYRDPISEKQASYAVRLIERHKDIFDPVLKKPIRDAIDNPVWKVSVRKVVSREESIIEIIEVNPSETTLQINEKQPIIRCKFPYNHTMISHIKKRNSLSSLLFKGSWNKNSYTWDFLLNEINISWIYHTFKDFIAKFDDEFVAYIGLINDTINNLENHVPVLDVDSESFFIKNIGKSTIKIESENVIQAVYRSKNYGVNIWSENVIQQLESCSYVDTLKQICNSSSTLPGVINPSKVNSSIFGVDLLKYGGPVAIILSSGTELDSLREWLPIAEQAGIKKEEIYVHLNFSSQHSKKHDVIKHFQLGKDLNSSTKLCFFNMKIPKFFYADPPKIKTAIIAGVYHFKNYTIDLLVENSATVVYYSNLSNATDDNLRLFDQTKSRYMHSVRNNEIIF